MSGGELLLQSLEEAELAPTVASGGVAEVPSRDPSQIGPRRDLLTKERRIAVDVFQAEVLGDLILARK